MIAIAHFLAITLYLGAAALAAAPFARPVPAPVRGVTTLLGLGVIAHLAALLGFVSAHGQAPLSGLGPALSFAALLVAVLLLAVELIAREVSVSLAAAPLAAALAAVANIAGLVAGGRRQRRSGNLAGRARRAQLPRGRELRHRRRGGHDVPGRAPRAEGTALRTRSFDSSRRSTRSIASIISRVSRAARPSRSGSRSRWRTRSSFGPSTSRKSCGAR